MQRFGGLLVQFHPSLLEALSPQLKSPRLAVRKRSIIALGHLVMSCDQILYLKLINYLLDELGTSNGGGHSTQNTRTYIQVRFFPPHFPVFDRSKGQVFKFQFRNFGDLKQLCQEVREASWLQKNCLKIFKIPNCLL